MLFRSRVVDNVKLGLPAAGKHRLAAHGGDDGHGIRGRGGWRGGTKGGLGSVRRFYLFILGSKLSADRVSHFVTLCAFLK